jgi:uncharacterized MnhB-related membrane protein
LKKKGFLIKKAADVSMTSALLGSWAVSGLKVPLGRKQPSGSAQLAQWTEVH